MTATMTQQLATIRQAELRAEAAENRLAASITSTSGHDGRPARTWRVAALVAGLVAALVH